MRTRIDPTADDAHGNSGRSSEIDDATDDLALETGDVELTFPGDHDVGVAQVIVQADLVGDHVEAGDQGGTEGQEAAGESTGGTGTGRGRHVDAVCLLVELHESFETGLEETDLPGGRSLLGTELARRFEEEGFHVTGDEEFDAS